MNSSLTRVDMTSVFLLPPAADCVTEETQPREGFQVYSNWKGSVAIIKDTCPWEKLKKEKNKRDEQTKTKSRQ